MFKQESLFELQQEISNNVVCVTSKGSDQPAHAHRAFASRFNILWVLNYWPNVMLSFYALKEAARACLSLHLLK